MAPISRVITMESDKTRSVMLIKAFFITKTFLSILKTVFQ